MQKEKDKTHDKSSSTKTRENMSKGQVLAGWTFSEYIQYERTRRWYIWGGLLMAGLVIWSLVTLNILFTLIIILFAIILYAQGKKPPVDVEFKIFESGAQIGAKFYKYKEIINFWIIYEPPHAKNLYLCFKNKIKPVLSIPLEKQNPIKIRKILLKYIDEDLDKDEESFSEILGRRLKI